MRTTSAARRPSTACSSCCAHRLSTVRLVLASRFDPALPVARLRLEERLCEVRTAQLAFSPDETATLAELCGLHLTAVQTADLHARTDGWAAGIRLATLPLRDHASPERFLADFSGDERPVADYLAGEVFSHISPEEGDLLRRTSISDPIPAGLATELAGRADAVDVLRALERSTGLVVASGAHRTEFRIQELMRTYLTADLYRHGPAAAAQLHRQAAVWWAAQNRPIEALRHAAQAGDRTLLTDLPAPVGGRARGTRRARRAAPRRGHRAGAASRRTTPGCRSCPRRSTSGAATVSRPRPTSTGQPA